jgi:predicted nucleic acid-binding protein
MQQEELERENENGQRFWGKKWPAMYLMLVPWSLLEVNYGFIRDIGITKTQEIIKKIDDTPLAVISTISQQAYNEAARIKGTHSKLSLADSVGIATAAELDATFVTSDHHELEVIAAKEPSLKFFWFR